MTEEPERLVRIADVVKELGLSPSRVRQLADLGIIPSTRTAGGHRLFDLAAVRAAVARRSLSGDSVTAAEPSWRRELTLLGLSEDVVWLRVKEDLQIPSDTRAGRIMVYAFTEMLNNAIDHSGSDTVVVSVWVTETQWCFEIKDFGIGVFAKLASGLRLGNEFESIQELSKGKRTTSPDGHTGEGIFFTSKMVDIFRLSSSALRWTVDNIRADVALGSIPAAPGTSVQCQIDPQTERVTTDVFREFTADHEFVRTRPLVKLFEIGAPFVSRSEARRLLDGLDEDFEAVEVDFTGVTDVGQGFVDELLRVWPSAHPGKSVRPVNMNAAVEFMVNRARRR
jgi:anti-sigma regulatory factor (Ser/Thr protein kinase)